MIMNLSNKMSRMELHNKNQQRYNLEGEIMNTNQFKGPYTHKYFKGREEM